MAIFSKGNAEAEPIPKGSSPAEGNKISSPLLRSYSDSGRFVLLIIL